MVTLDAPILTALLTRDLSDGAKVTLTLLAAGELQSAQQRVSRSTWYKHTEELERVGIPITVAAPRPSFRTPSPKARRRSRVRGKGSPSIRTRGSRRPRRECTTHTGSRTRVDGVYYCDDCGYVLPDSPNLRTPRKPRVKK